MNRYFEGGITKLAQLFIDHYRSMIAFFLDPLLAFLPFSVPGHVRHLFLHDHPRLQGWPARRIENWANPWRGAFAFTSIMRLSTRDRFWRVLVRRRTIGKKT